jgi:hypothetical protein
VTRDFIGREVPRTGRYQIVGTFERKLNSFKAKCGFIPNLGTGRWYHIMWWYHQGTEGPWSCVSFDIIEGSGLAPSSQSRRATALVRPDPHAEHGR